MKNQHIIARKPKFILLDIKICIIRFFEKKKLVIYPVCSDKYKNSHKIIDNFLYRQIYMLKYYYGSTLYRNL